MNKPHCPKNTQQSKTDFADPLDPRRVVRHRPPHRLEPGREHQSGQPRHLVRGPPPTQAHPRMDPHPRRDQQGPVLAHPQQDRLPAPLRRHHHPPAPQGRAPPAPRPSSIAPKDLSKQISPDILNRLNRAVDRALDDQVHEHTGLGTNANGSGRAWLGTRGPQPGQRAGDYEAVPYPQAAHTLGLAPLIDAAPPF